MTGYTISHYKILEKIGEGGMGVVYKALDTVLERTVAIKFLSSQVLPAPTDQARFAREARAAASLNHPNVTTIFEFGEAPHPESDRKLSFIVMEYVEGEVLSSKIANGPLPMDEAEMIAIAVAEAIAKAHTNGIIHRDLKPDNIMISKEGSVKVMDFGLAEIAGRSRVTREGSTVGTVAYMSPEQARGEVVDERSDLWSLGVVLYEMLTGKRPFEAPFEQACIYQILNTEPEPAKSLLPGIPDALDGIIQRLLVKDSAHRCQTATELVADLRELHPGGVGSDIPSGSTRTVSSHTRPTKRRMIFTAAVLAGIVVIASLVWAMFLSQTQPVLRSLAVLPFENISPDPEQEYFADGMTDQLISELSKIRSLRVISRTSAMQFKGRRESLAEIAKVLDVEGIVTATVFRSGERLRVNAQLIRPQDEASLWGDSYDRPIADVLELTSTLARSIASEIKAVLTPAEITVLSENRAVNPEAFDLVARGFFLLNSSADRENLEKGLQLMYRAIQLDPTYVDGYVGVAHAFLALHSFRYMTGTEIYDRAKAALDKGIELDPDNGRAHSFMGQLLWIGGDMAGCIAAHEKAVQLSPNDGLVRTIRSWILMAEGRFDEAIAEAETAVRLDPLSHFARCNLMGWYYCDDRYQDAQSEALSILEMAPHWVPAQEMLMWIAYREGRLDDAVNEARKLWAMTSGPAVPEGISWKEYVQWAITALEGQSGRSAPGFLAMYYGVQGDNDKALALLERAAEQADPITLLLFYPEFDSLRTDPRFAQLVSRIQLPVSAYCEIDFAAAPDTTTQAP